MSRRAVYAEQNVTWRGGRDNSKGRQGRMGDIVTGGFQRNDLVRTIANLPQGELDAIKALAERRHTTVTQVIREAFQTETFIQGQVDDGAMIIAKKGQCGREVEFPHMRA